MSTYYISFDEVVEKIVKETGKSKTDILKLIEEKMSDFKGLISHDAAALIVAKEEKVDISSVVKPIKTTREMLTVSELFEGMKSVNIVLRVLHIYPMKEFTKKEKKGKLIKAVLADSTGVISACLWNQHADLGKELTKGDVLLMKGAYTKMDQKMHLELHAGNSTVLEVNPLDVNIPKKISAPEIKIEMLSEGSEEIPYFSFTAQIMKILTFKKTEDSSFASMIVADDTGAAVLRVYNCGEIKEGEFIRVPVAYKKSNREGDERVIITSLADIEKVGTLPFKPSLEKVEELQKLQDYTRKYIRDIQEGDYVEIRGTLVEVFEPKWFENEDSDHNIVMSGYVDDGTEVIMTVFFGTKAASLLSKDIEWLFNADEEKIKRVIRTVRGKEILVKGKVQLNNYSKKLEVIVASVEEADPITELQILAAATTLTGGD